VRASDEARGRFWKIATAGMFFQGGAAAIDTGTIVASLVHGLTGSTAAVGAAAAIARYGWLFPQLFTAYYAGRRRRRLPFYMAGAFGRVACLALVSLLLVPIPPERPSLVAGFFVLWTVLGLHPRATASSVASPALPTAGLRPTGALGNSVARRSRRCFRLYRDREPVRAGRNRPDRR
jgi:hypothetical protein